MRRREANPTLSCAQQQLLRATIIDECSPGTLLHDFDDVLRLAVEQPLYLTPMHQLPRPILPEINARLAHPLRHGLDQPHVQSLPHVQGLFLLLRASGLTIVEELDGQPVLVVDGIVLEAWNRLNATERYCALLEAWLLRGRPEILDQTDRWGSKAPNAFCKWQMFFERLSPSGVIIGGDSEAEAALRIHPGLNNLALLELFGLVFIDHGTAEAGKGWRIERVRPTALGDALLDLLNSGFWCQAANVEMLGSSTRQSIGLLQPTIQPYWPGWQENLSLPEWSFREGAHVFKVSLGSMWHRVAIPGSYTVEGLAEVILDAVSFHPEHLYHIRYRNRFGIQQTIYDPEATEGLRADEIRVGDLRLCVGHSMTFTYDLSRETRFPVSLEQVDPALILQGPVILEQRRRAYKQRRQ